MTYFNKQGNGANILNTTDIVANSISLIAPDGTLQTHLQVHQMV